MTQASAAPLDGVKAEASALPLRLRYLVLAVVLAALGSWAAPRLHALLVLQSAGTAVADYAVCMAGPTAIAALKRDPEPYLALLRRRVIASAWDEAPFAACTKLASRLPGARPEPQIQRAQAGAFVEYGARDSTADGGPGAATPAYTIESLSLTSEPIVDLDRRAWPFSRGAALSRIQASSRALEAPHPVGAPRPLRGAGLPHGGAWYRSVRVDAEGVWLAHGHGANLTVLHSRDGGLHWRMRAQSTTAVVAVKERCLADEALHAFVFSTDGAGANTTVRSLDRDGALVMESPLASTEYSIVGAGCSAGAMTVLLRREAGGPGMLVACVHGSVCSPMRSPSLAASSWLEPHLTDVARVGRTTIVATESSGIVRVSSTHDDGRTWTPFTVAYDAVESNPWGSASPPQRLLVIGKRLMLHSEPVGPKGSYWLVVSDDLGASWSGAS